MGSKCCKPEDKIYSDVAKIVEQRQHLSNNASGPYSPRSATPGLEEVSVMEIIPEFVTPLGEYSFKVNAKGKISVTIQNLSPELKVTWYRHGKKLDATSDSRFLCTVDGNNVHSLTILQVHVEDEGKWACIAENIIGRQVSHGLIKLMIPRAYKPPEFVEPLRAILTDAGTVSLECKVTGVPTPLLQWFKDGEAIKPGDVFALKQADPTSLGSYTCKATNCMGMAMSCSHIHVSSSRPVITDGLVDHKARIGEPHVLTVGVRNPVGKVTWHNKGIEVTEDERVSMSQNDFTVELVLNPLMLTDDGEWKCNVNGIETSCFLSVVAPKNYRKPRFLQDLKAVLTEEGLVTFECKVVGYPTPELKWYKDGVELKPGDVYQLCGSNSLGLYTCIASNCMGVSESTAELTFDDIQFQLSEEERGKLLEHLSSVNRPPQFVRGLKSATVLVGTKMELKVELSSKCFLEWYFENQMILPVGSEFVIEGNTLFTDSLNVGREGEYKCVAKNEYGTSFSCCRISLNVPSTYKKPKFLEGLRAVLHEGIVNLECKVIGVPQPILKWFKDGVELKAGDIHKIVSSGGNCCLGTYTCQARNCMGICESSASLLGFEENKQHEDIVERLARDPSLSTILEERSSQMISVYETAEGLDEISVSIDGKEVSVSLYETPDLTEQDAKNIIEMFADEYSEYISEHSVLTLPSLRFVKETTNSGRIVMEAMVIDVDVEGFETAPNAHENDSSSEKTEADFEEISDLSESRCVDILEDYEAVQVGAAVELILEKAKTLSSLAPPKPINTTVSDGFKILDIPEDEDFHVVEVKSPSPEASINSDSVETPIFGSLEQLPQNIEEEDWEVVDSKKIGHGFNEKIDRFGGKINEFLHQLNKLTAPDDPTSLLNREVTQPISQIMYPSELIREESQESLESNQRNESVRKNSMAQTAQTKEPKNCQISESDFNSGDTGDDQLTKYDGDNGDTVIEPEMQECKKARLISQYLGGSSTLTQIDKTTNVATCTGKKQDDNKVEVGLQNFKETYDVEGNDNFLKSMEKTRPKLEAQKSDQMQSSLLVFDESKKSVESGIPDGANGSRSATSTSLSLEEIDKDFSFYQEYTEREIKQMQEFGFKIAQIMQLQDAGEPAKSVLDVTANGFHADQVTVLHNQQIVMSDVLQFQDVGLTAKDVEIVHAKGIKANEVVKMRLMGLQTSDILALLSQGLSPEEIIVLMEGGYEAGKIFQMKSEGFQNFQILELQAHHVKPQEFEALKSHGLKYVEIIMLKDAGLQNSEIMKLKEQGLSANEILQLQELGLSALEISHMHKEGLLIPKISPMRSAQEFNNEEVKRLQQHGLQESEIAQLKEHGLTAVKITQLSQEGLLSLEMAPLTKQGLLVPEIIQLRRQGIQAADILQIPGILQLKDQDLKSAEIVLPQQKQLKFTESAPTNQQEFPTAEIFHFKEHGFNAAEIIQFKEQWLDDGTITQLKEQGLLGAETVQLVDHKLDPSEIFQRKKHSLQSSVEIAQFQMHGLDASETVTLKPHDLQDSTIVLPHEKGLQAREILLMTQQGTSSQKNLENSKDTAATPEVHDYSKRLGPGSTKQEPRESVPVDTNPPNTLATESQNLEESEETHTWFLTSGTGIVVQKSENAEESFQKHKTDQKSGEVEKKSAKSSASDAVANKSESLENYTPKLECVQLVDEFAKYPKAVEKPAEADVEFEQALDSTQIGTLKGIGVQGEYFVKLHDLGLKTAEIIRLHESNISVTEVVQILQQGLRISEILEFQAEGLQVSEIIALQQSGLHFVELVDLKAQGLKISEIVQLTQEGIEKSEIIQIINEGLQVADIVELKQEGLIPSEILDLTNLGIKTVQMVELKKLGLHVADIIMMKHEGVQPSEIFELKREGLEPSEIIQISKRGISATDVAEMKTAGLKTAEIVKLTNEGLKAAEVIALKKKGLCTADIMEMKHEGLQSAYVIQLPKNDVTATNIIEFQKLDLDASEIGEVKNFGIDSTDIVEMKNEGFRTTEVVELPHEGLDTSEIVTLKQKDVKTVEIIEIMRQGLCNAENSKIAKEGINTAEAIEIKKVSLGVTDMIEVQHEGLQNAEVLQLINYGLEAAEIIELNKQGIKSAQFEELKKEGLQNLEVIQIGKAGIKPEEAIAMKQKGVSVVDMVELKKQGLKMVEIIQLRKEGLQTADIVELIKEGLQAAEVIEMKKDGVTVAEMVELNNAGLTISEVVQLKNEGLLVAEICELNKNSMTPAEVTAMKKEGITVSQMSEMKKHGLNTIEILELSRCGIVPAEIVKLTKEGIQAFEIAKMKKEGITVSEMVELKNEGAKSADVVQLKKGGLEIADIIELIKEGLLLTEMLALNQEGLQSVRVDDLKRCGLQTAEIVRIQKQGVNAFEAAQLKPEGVEETEIVKMAKQGLKIAQILEMKKLGLEVAEISALITCNMKPEDIIQLKQKGLQTLEIADLKKQGLETATIIELRDQGLQVAEMAQAKLQDLQSVDIGKLQQLGLNITQILELKAKGLEASDVLNYTYTECLNIAELAQLKQFGLRIEEILQLTECGIETADIVQLKTHGLDTAEIILLQKQGVVAKEIIDLQQQGLKTTEIIQLSRQGGLHAADILKLTRERIPVLEICELVVKHELQVAEIVELKALGLQTAELSQLKQAGLPTPAIIQLKTLGLQATEIAQLTGRGLSTGEIVQLTSYGLQIAEILQLNDYKLQTQEIVQLKDQGICTSDILALKGIGLSISEIIRMKHLQMPASEILELKYHGLHAEEIIQLKHQGLQTAQILELRGSDVKTAEIIFMSAKGVTPMEIIKLKNFGLSTEEVVTMIDQGLSPSEIAILKGEDLQTAENVELKASGFPMVDILDMEDQGMGVQEMIQMQSYGLKPKEVAEVKEPELLAADILQLRALMLETRDIQQLQALGLSATEIIQLTDVGLSTAEIVQLTKYKFQTPEIIELRLIGVQSSEMIQLREQGGLQTPDICQLKKCDVSTPEILVLIDQGLQCAEIIEVKKRGLVAADITVLVQRGATTLEIMQIVDQGLKTSEVIQLLDNGLQTAQIIQLRDQGLSIADVISLQSQGLETAKLLDLKKEGLSAKEMIVLQELGISPAEFDTSQEAGVSWADIAVALQAGCTPEEVVRLKNRGLSTVEMLQLKRLEVSPMEALTLHEFQPGEVQAILQRGLLFPEIKQLLSRSFSVANILMLCEKGSSAKQIIQLSEKGYTAHEIVQMHEKGLKTTEVAEMQVKGVKASEIIEFQNQGLQHLSVIRLLEAGFTIGNIQAWQLTDATAAEIFLLHDNGFMISSIRELIEHGLTTSDILKIHMQGMKANEIIPLIKLGLNTSEISIIKGTNFENADICRMVERGATVSHIVQVHEEMLATAEVIPLLEKGLTIPEVLDLRREGVENVDIFQLNINGFRIQEVQQMKSLGLKIVDIVQLAQSGLTFVEILQLVKQGVKTYEAVQLKEKGVPAAQIIELDRKGLKFADVVRSEEEGLQIAEMLELLDAGLNVDSISCMCSKGFKTTEILQLQKQGVSPREAVQMCVRGRETTEAVKLEDEGLSISDVLQLLEKSFDVNEIIALSEERLTASETVQSVEKIKVCIASKENTLKTTSPEGKIRNSKDGEKCPVQLTAASSFTQKHNTKKGESEQKKQISPPPQEFTPDAQNETESKQVFGKAIKQCSSDSSKDTLEARYSQTGSKEISISSKNRNPKDFQVSTKSTATFLTSHEDGDKNASNQNIQGQNMNSLGEIPYVEFNNDEDKLQEYKKAKVINVDLIEVRPSHLQCFDSSELVSEGKVEMTSIKPRATKVSKIELQPLEITDSKLKDDLNPTSAPSTQTFPGDTEISEGKLKCHGDSETQASNTKATIGKLTDTLTVKTEREQVKTKQNESEKVGAHKYITGEDEKTIIKSELLEIAIQNKKKDKNETQAVAENIQEDRGFQAAEERNTWGEALENKKPVSPSPKEIDSKPAGKKITIQTDHKNLKDEASNMAIKEKEIGMTETKIEPEFEQQEMEARVADENQKKEGEDNNAEWMKKKEEGENKQKKEEGKNKKKKEEDQKKKEEDQKKKEEDQKKKEEDQKKKEEDQKKKEEDQKKKEEDEKKKLKEEAESAVEKKKIIEAKDANSKQTSGENHKHGNQYEANVAENKSINVRPEEKKRKQKAAGTEKEIDAKPNDGNKKNAMGADASFKIQLKEASENGKAEESKTSEDTKKNVVKNTMEEEVTENKAIDDNNKKDHRRKSTDDYKHKGAEYKGQEEAKAMAFSESRSDCDDETQKSSIVLDISQVAEVGNSTADNHVKTKNEVISSNDESEQIPSKRDSNKIADASKTSESQMEPSTPQDPKVGGAPEIPKRQRSTKFRCGVHQGNVPSSEGNTQIGTNFVGNDQTTSNDPQTSHRAKQNSTNRSDVLKANLKSSNTDDTESSNRASQSAGSSSLPHRESSDSSLTATLAITSLRHESNLTNEKDEITDFYEQRIYTDCSTSSSTTAYEHCGEAFSDNFTRNFNDSRFSATGKYTTQNCATSGSQSPTAAVAHGRMGTEIDSSTSTASGSAVSFTNFRQSQSSYNLATTSNRDVTDTSYASRHQTKTCPRRSVSAASYKVKNNKTSGRHGVHESHDYHHEYYSCGGQQVTNHDTRSLGTFDEISNDSNFASNNKHDSIRPTEYSNALNKRHNTKQVTLLESRALELRNVQNSISEGQNLATLQLARDYMKSLGYHSRNEEHDSSLSGVDDLPVDCMHGYSGLSRRRPRFTIRLTDRVISFGSALSLNCSATGNPLPNLQWLRNGFPIVPNTKVRIIGGIGFGSIELHSVGKDDQAEYSCIATNIFGKAHTSSTVHVFDLSNSKSAATVPVSFYSQLITETRNDNEIVLETYVKGHEELCWMKDNEPVSGPNYRSQSFSDGKCRITIKNPKATDSGSWSLTAKNRYSMKSLTKYVKVEEYPFPFRFKLPFFIKGPKDLTVEIGDSVIISVTVEDADTVQFFKSGKLRETQVNKIGSYSACIPFVQLEDLGIYVAVAKNQHGQVESSCSLRLISGPAGALPTFVVKPKPVYVVDAGVDLNICIEVNGEPIPYVNWYKGCQNVVLENPRAFRESLSSGSYRFTIRRVAGSDAGIYSLKAKNLSGEETVQFFVQVKNMRARSLTPVGSLSERRTSLSPKNRNWASVERLARSYRNSTLQSLAYSSSISRERLGPEMTIPENCVCIKEVLPGWVSVQWKRIRGRTFGYFVHCRDLTEENSKWVQLGFTKLCSHEANLVPGRDYIFRITPECKSSAITEEDDDKFCMFSESFFLSNRAVPEFIQLLPVSTVGEIGKPYIFRCQLREGIPCNVTWYKDEEPVDHEESGCRVCFANHVAELEIFSVSEGDSGKFCCEAKNYHGRTISYTHFVSSPNGQGVISCYLDQMEFPLILMEPKNRIVKSGSNAIVTCQVSTEKCDVQWIFNGKSIQDDDSSYTLTRSGNFYSLEINSASLERSGKYSVAVRNSSGTSTSQFNIHVKDDDADFKPKFLNEKCIDITVPKGEKFTLHGFVMGSGILFYTWKKDGRLIHRNRYKCYIIEHERDHASLTVKEAAFVHFGKYHCIVKNTYGEDVITFNVRVTEPVTKTILQQNYAEKLGFRRKPEELQIEEGDWTTLEFECEGDTIEPVRYKWFKDGLNVLELKDAQHFKTENFGSIYRLHIRDAKMQFSGAYKLFISSGNSNINGVVSLQIRCKTSGLPVCTQICPKAIKPMITKEVEKIVCEFRETVELRMEFEPNSNLFYVHWDTPGTVTTGQRFSSLVIPRVQGNMLISARVYNSVGFAVSQGSIAIPDINLITGGGGQVWYKQPKFFTSLHDKTARSGDESTTFFVSIKCNKLTRTKWLKDNHEIFNNNKYIVREDGDLRSLKIMNLGLYDSGIYAVNIENHARRDTSSCYLHVS